MGQTKFRSLFGNSRHPCRFPGHGDWRADLLGLRRSNLAGKVTPSGWPLSSLHQYVVTFPLSTTERLSPPHACCIQAPSKSSASSNLADNPFRFTAFSLIDLCAHLVCQVSERERLKPQSSRVLNSLQRSTPRAASTPIILLRDMSWRPSAILPKTIYMLTSLSSTLATYISRVNDLHLQLQLHCVRTTQRLSPNLHHPPKSFFQISITEGQDKATSDWLEDGCSPGVRVWLVSKIVEQ